MVELADFAVTAVRMQRATAFPAEVTLAHMMLASEQGTKTYGTHNYFGLTEAQAPEQPVVILQMKDTFTQTQLDRFSEIDRQRIVSSDPAVSDWTTVTVSNRFPCFASADEAARCYVRLMQTKQPFAAAWRGYWSGGNSLSVFGGRLTNTLAFASMLSGVARFIDMPAITKANPHLLDATFIDMLDSVELGSRLADAWAMIMGEDDATGKENRTPAGYGTAAALQQASSPVH